MNTKMVAGVSWGLTTRSIKGRKSFLFTMSMKKLPCCVWCVDEWQEISTWLWRCRWPISEASEEAEKCIVLIHQQYRNQVDRSWWIKAYQEDWWHSWTGGIKWIESLRQASRKGHWSKKNTNNVLRFKNWTDRDNHKPIHHNFPERQHRLCRFLQQRGLLEVNRR